MQRPRGANAACSRGFIERQSTRSAAGDLLAGLRAGGPMFPQNLPKAANLVPAHVEMGLADLLARGFVTCDSFAALRQMITPPSRRRHALVPVGRWCCFRQGTVPFC